MTLDAISIAAAFVVFAGAVGLALPVASRPDIFFSVHVGEGFRTTAFARHTLRAYRVVVIVATLTALAGVLLLRPPMGVVAAGFGYSIFTTAAWAWARQRLLPHASQYPQIRRASLATRNLELPGGPIGVGLPFLVLFSSAAFVFWQWDAIPERIVTHWDSRGVADGWRVRSVSVVAGPFVMGACIMVLTLIQTMAILRRTRQHAIEGPAADAELHYKRTNARLGVLALYTMSILFSYVGTRPVLATSDSIGPGLWIILGFIVVIAAATTLWMIRVGQGGQRRVDAEDRSVEGDATPDRAWKAGFFYFNPSDSAMFVEQRMGVGYTLNFGNKWAWVFIAGMFVPLLLILLTRD